MKKKGQYIASAIIGSLAVFGLYLWKSGKFDSFFSSPFNLDGSVGGGGGSDDSVDDPSVLYYDNNTQDEVKKAIQTENITHPVYKSSSSGEIIDIFTQTTATDPNRYAESSDGGYVDRYKQQSIGKIQASNEIPFIKTANKILSSINRQKSSVPVSSNTTQQSKEIPFVNLVKSLNPTSSSSGNQNKSKSPNSNSKSTKTPSVGLSAGTYKIGNNTIKVSKTTYSKGHRLYKEK